MYLVTIHVPIFVRGSQRLLSTDWKRSLVLLRDSFGGRYGPIRVVAPSIEATDEQHDQLLEPVTAADEIELFPSFPYSTRARAFWTEHVHTWRRDVAAHLPHADVVHAGFDDVYRPMMFMGFLLAERAGTPTVFVQDTDHVLQMSELTRDAGPPGRLKARIYTGAYEHAVRYGVARASLSLLKGHAVLDRYERYARNARNFHDTSFLSHEVVEDARLSGRLEELQRGRPLRLVYCGRLEARKGVSDSIEAVAQARAQGARLKFDIIGEGVVRPELERRVEQLGVRDAVRFLGMRAYGPELLSELACYDGLLFTPTAEDTPRMIFDGYAAGLPLIGYAVPYVREREREDAAVLAVPRDVQSMAAALLEIDRERPRLAALACKAREAAEYHAADAWYRRRAEWTHDAVEQHWREQRREVHGGTPVAPDLR